MKPGTRNRWQRRLVALGMSGTVFAFPWGSCDLGEFTTTSTVTLSGRDVVSFLVRSAVLTPVETAVDRVITNLFDKLEGEDDE